MESFLQFAEQFELLSAGGECGCLLGERRLPVVTLQFDGNPIDRCDSHRTLSLFTAGSSVVDWKSGIFDWCASRSPDLLENRPNVGDFSSRSSTSQDGSVELVGL